MGLGSTSYVVVNAHLLCAPNSARFSWPWRSLSIALRELPVPGHSGSIQDMDVRGKRRRVGACGLVLVSPRASVSCGPRSGNSMRNRAPLERSIILVGNCNLDSWVCDGVFGVAHILMVGGWLNTGLAGLHAGTRRVGMHQHI